MVEGARLESVYAPQGHRGFESHPLCKSSFKFPQNPLNRTIIGVFSLQELPNHPLIRTTLGAQFGAPSDHKSLVPRIARQPLQNQPVQQMNILFRIDIRSTLLMLKGC